MKRAEWSARRWDSGIAVNDPDAEEVVTSARFPKTTMIPTNGLHWYVEEQDELGVISHVVPRAGLEGR